MDEKQSKRVGIMYTSESYLSSRKFKRELKKKYTHETSVACIGIKLVPATTWYRLKERERMAMEVGASLEVNNVKENIN